MVVSQHMLHHSTCCITGALEKRSVLGWKFSPQLAYGMFVEAHASLRHWSILQGILLLRAPQSALPN